MHFELSSKLSTAVASLASSSLIYHLLVECSVSQSRVLHLTLANLITCDGRASLKLPRSCVYSFHKTIKVPRVSYEFCVQMPTADLLCTRYRQRDAFLLHTVLFCIDMRILVTSIKKFAYKRRSDYRLVSVGINFPSSYPSYCKVFGMQCVQYNCKSADSRRRFVSLV